MRAWADHEPQAADVVRRVYADRSQFVEELFRRIGFRGVALKVRIQLLLSYLSWEPSMMLDEGERARKVVLAEVHQLLTAR